MSSQHIVTFSKIPNARTGNIILQYFCCIRMSILYGHKYVAIEDVDMQNIAKESPLLKITDDSINLQTGDNETRIRTSHLLCEGFFQKNELYLSIRERMLGYFATTDDYWIGVSGKREYIRDFFTSQHSTEILSNDIVMSIRLDDFIQLPLPRSDILPPQYYTDILEKWFSQENRSDGRLIIVGDKFRHHWEHKYIEYFAKWSPILVQKSLMEDFALMRNCPALIHSNSSLCWIASFLSEKTHRFIPITGTYSSQHLEEISPTDVVIRIKPMEHKEVYALNVMCWHRDLNSLPYCIPDELFADSVLPIDGKKYVISPLIPGDTSHYLFRAGEEAKYYEMYRLSMFAHTKKKGGWDCLRHYEILAAGCIPIFEDLEKCPDDTLSSFPKTLLKDAYSALLPWRNTDEQRAAYTIYASLLFEVAKETCSMSANVRDCLKLMEGSSTPPKILMLTGHAGINYTRELNWIGIKRWADSVGTEAVEYPQMDFLYDDFPESRLSELYGNGFTYSRRLSSRLRREMSEQEVVLSIQQKKWDIIIYGKVGPDETAVGSIPMLPFWSHVFKRYSRDEIAFWYGGDEMQDMTYANRYSDHLVRNSQYARCFVRELIKWDGNL